MMRSCIYLLMLVGLVCMYSQESHAYSVTKSVTVTGHGSYSPMMHHRGGHHGYNNHHRAYMNHWYRQMCYQNYYMMYWQWMQAYYRWMAHYQRRRGFSMGLAIGGFRLGINTWG